MADPLIMMRVKEAFFDSKAVMEAVDRGRRSALSKAGAYVRRVTQNLIRTRRGSAAEGQPPNSHTGDLKRLIFFAYDATSRSVVIGPVRFKQGEAPNLLEFGGDAMRPDKAGRLRQVHYRPHPFMAPGLEKSLPYIPSHWANCVRSK